MSIDKSVLWVPTFVDGADGVRNAAVFPDRLELRCDQRLITIRFSDVARSPIERGLSKLLSVLRLKRNPGIVADRDFFQEPGKQFFRFYSEPKVSVGVPGDENLPYPESTFCRVRSVISAGGFETFDLG